MEDESNISIKTSRNLLIIIVILILIIILAIGYIVIRRSIPPSNTTPAPAPRKVAVPEVKTEYRQLNLDSNGVRKGAGFYAVLGRIQLIDVEGDNFILTVVSHTGQVSLREFKGKISEIINAEQIEKNGEITPIKFTDLKVGDSVDISLNGNEQTDTYTISKLYRYKE